MFALTPDDVSLACLHLEEFIEYLSASEQAAISIGKSDALRQNIAIARSAKSKLESMSSNISANECDQVIHVLRLTRNSLEESLNSLPTSDRPDALRHLSQLNRTIRKFRKILEVSPPPHI